MNVLKVQDNPPKDWQKYDLCLILPTEAATCRIRSDAMMFIRTVAKILGKKYLYIYYSDDGMRVYLLIRAGLKLLRAKAHSEKWKLLLDENACQQTASEGSEGDFINAFSVPHNPQVTSIRPFEYLYADYNAEEEVEHLYQCSRHSKHPFHKALRIKMLFDFFDKNTSTEQSLSLEKLRDAGTVTEMFAIHFLQERNEIAKHMFGWFPQRVPEELLQHYFGEEITLYFAFLDHMFGWQLLPAIVGVAFQATAITFDHYSRSEIPAFAFFLIFWNITAVQWWRKKQFMLSLKWNTLGSDLTSRLKGHERSQFHGIHIKSPIDGKEMLFSPTSRRWRFYFLSFVVFVICICGAMVGVGAIYYYARPRISDTIVAPYEQWVISGGTVLQIMICNFLYYYIALFTTDWENHRLEKDFVSSFAVKLSSFQIINTLASSMYLAFAARFVSERDHRTNSLGDCGYDNCIFPVVINVVTIASVRVLIHCFFKFLLPYIRYWILFSCFGAYQDREFSRQQATAGDTTVVTVTGGDGQLEDHAATPDMGKIYRSNEYGHDDDVESTGGDTVLGRGSLSGGERRNSNGRKHSGSSERFTGVSPLKSRAAEPTSSSNNSTTHPHAANYKQSPRASPRATPMGSPRASPISSGRKRPNNPAQQQQVKLQQQSVPPFPVPPRPQKRLSKHSTQDDEHSKNDDFDEEDDLASELSDGIDESQHHRGHRKSIRPDMTRTMSSYMQYRHQQEQQEGNSRGNPRTMSSSVLVRDDDDGRGSDDDNEIAVDPFNSYVYHTYDHVQQHVNWYNDLLGILVLSWCFGSMLPGIFALIFIWLAVETRGQAWLLLYLYPRPIPRTAENIEPWLDIFDVCLMIGILSNAGLIVFTMTEFADWSLGYKCALWIGIVLFLQSYNALLRRFFSQIPEEIIIQKQRNLFIEQKLVKRHPDLEDTLPMEML